MKSHLAVPLQAGGKILGGLGVSSFQAYREWPPELVSRLQLLATIFTSALARKWGEERIKAEWAVTFNSIRDLVSFHDKEFRITRVNKAFAEALGMEEEKLIGQKCYEIIHGTGEPLLPCPHKQTLDDGKPVTEEFWEPRLGMYLQVSVSPILNDRKEVVGSVHIAKDITQRKQAEEALQKAHDDLEKRVKERTGELRRANVQLAQEIEDRKRTEGDLQKAYFEIEQLKEKLEAENIYLRDEIKMEHQFDRIIGQSDALKYVLFRVEQVAPADTTVLILGETGTGKGLVAHAIHSLSLRRNRPMVTVNCAALPANLIESELFGREKGAFTGSHARQMGRFEVADRGTILLDEIGELPLELQAKLLRVIQDGEFERVGSSRTIKVNVRILASTSRELKEEARRGRFREDLYYRIHVFPVTMPPLRQRREDIPLLVNNFVNRFAKKMGKEVKTIPKETMKALETYHWPGNVRELENVIERAVITTSGSVLRLAEKIIALQPGETKENPARELLNVERKHILKVLKETTWKIEGKNGAAEALGLNPSTLRGKMRKLGIKK
ncbi:MAG: sigma 54-interacting transcriptional regulator [Deltaproteobacteria bacterium]|nr:sigma 54-interacting transcriptional regulator [Deltaproteobacteria bacterium]